MLVFLGFKSDLTLMFWTLELSFGSDIFLHFLLGNCFGYFWQNLGKLFNLLADLAVALTSIVKLQWECVQTLQLIAWKRRFKKYFTFCLQKEYWRNEKIKDATTFSQLNI